MSKIGRKPIDISGVTVDLKGQEVHSKGPKASGVYFIPESLAVAIEGDTLLLTPSERASSLKKREINREWGMHRALLSNVISGAKKEFEKIVEIVGLGYKAAVSGNKIVFSLGYSHKIDFPIPTKKITVSVDKTGQKLTISSPDRELLGQVCSDICALRRPEPYKGTGVKLSTDYIVRKAVKGK